MENRTYRYFKGEVLYPFGFGLSYTTFKYSNLKIPEISKINNDILVKVNISNTGNRDGEEVVQLYVSHKNAEFIAPVRALKGFQRVFLKAGETKTISFKLTNQQLSVVNEEGNTKTIRGKLEISVGGCQPTKEITERKIIKETIDIVD